jgi:hypothetical protein
LAVSGHFFWKYKKTIFEGAATIKSNTISNAPGPSPAPKK